MSTYTPDKWVVVEMTLDKHHFCRVLASWYGGFAGSDSWKMSSGITGIEEFDDRYEYANTSGSLYICYKQVVGMSGYTAGVFRNFEKEMAAAAPERNASLKIIDPKDTFTSIL